MVKMNKAQRESLKQKYRQNNQGMTYRQFRRSVQGGWGCVMVRWSGMWLGIESDGYTHS